MKKREINVVLKILTHTNVVVLTMLAEVGVSMNYFSQDSQNICSKIQWNFADLFFSYNAMRISMCTKQNNIPSICWFPKPVPNVSMSTCYSLSKFIHLSLPNVHLVLFCPQQVCFPRTNFCLNSLMLSICAIAYT